MSPEPSLLREVKDQPALLKRVLDRPAVRLRQLLTAEAGKRLWLVGCGDMFFAASAAAAMASCHFRRDDVRALRSLDARWWSGRWSAGDWVLGASISGRTARTREALARARAQGARTLVLTDDPHSPIAQDAHDTIVIGSAAPAELHGHVYAGYSSEVPQTRSYLAVLALLLAAVDPSDAERPGWCETAFAALNESYPMQSVAAEGLEKAVGEHGLHQVVVLAGGPFLEVARYGAAKFLEYAIDGRAQCLEEFHHLEMFVARQGMWLMPWIPDAASADRFAEVRGVHEELGARTFEWASHGPTANLPELPLPLSLLVGAQALQLSAFHVARALGRDVERWVGGVRRDQIFDLSQRTIRDSKIDLG